MAFVYAGAGRPVIYVHSANLTTAGRVLNLELSKDAVDVTAFSDSAHRNRTSLTDASLRYDGLFDDAAGTLTSHGALNDLLGGTRRVVTIWPAGNGTGTMGVGFGSAYASSYKPGGSIGGFVSLGADIMPDGTFDLITSLGSAITTAMVSGSGVGGPPIDAGGTVAGGARVYLHFTASGTGSFEVLLQDDPDGSGTDWTTVGTAPIIPAATTSTSFVYTVAAGTSIRRFRRWFAREKSVGTGTITFLTAIKNPL